MTQMMQVMAAGKIDPDAAAIIAAMTVPPNGARRTLINSTVLSLKAGGVWSLLDTIWFMAAHDDQAGRLNWKAPASFTLAANGGITFTADRGWQGNGTTGYLNTGWTPATHGVNYALNDASFGVYSRTNSPDAAAIDIGAISSGVSRNWIQLRTTSNNNSVDINSNGTTGQALVAAFNSLGLGGARRTASNATQIYRNGAQTQAGSQASSGVTAVSFFVGARNNNSTPDFFSPRQYAFAFTGAAMSEAQHAQFYTIVQDYMTAVGAAV
jgi:hypothetical protein